MFFIFTPKIGEVIQFDEHIFQTGWFNHQLVMCGGWILSFTPEKLRWYNLYMYWCEKIDKSDVKWHFMKRRTWSLRWCASFPTFDIPPWRSANKSWQNGKNHQFLFFALFTTNSGRTTVDQIPSFGKDRPMCIGLHICGFTVVDKLTGAEIWFQYIAIQHVHTFPIWGRTESDEDYLIPPFDSQLLFFHTSQ